jgi:uncharacterized repeat protein (TIGR01451 family)
MAHGARMPRRPAGTTQISNTASIADDGANGADPTPGNNSSSDTTPLTAAPDFSITKSDAGASVAPGGTVSYTLTYANSGNISATGVVLTETVPANTTFNTGASTAGWVCLPNNNAGSTCTLTIGALATHTDLIRSPLVRTHLPMLALAAREIGGVQIQNRGTLGGNVANASPAARSAKCSTEIA